MCAELVVVGSAPGDAAAVEQSDLVGNVERLAQLMGTDDDGLARIAFAADELGENVRARSAIMRVAEKIA